MRLQNALEYLSTYGWAVILIMIVIGVLFALGVFTASNYQSAECSFSNGFSCTNVSMTTNGLLTYTLTDATNDPVNVIGYGCALNETGAQPSSILSPSRQTYLPVGSNHTYTTYCYVSATSYYKGGAIGSPYSGYIAVEYQDDITSEITIGYGRLVVKET